MAFTDAQKVQIRKLLGYPDPDRGLYNAIEGAFLAISADAEAEIVAILALIDAVDAQLSASLASFKVKKAEDVEFWGPTGLQMMYREGNRLVQCIATILGVHVMIWPYGSRGGYMLRRG